MTATSFFEIGGELIELQSDYQYQTGQIDIKKRKQQQEISRHVKSIGKDVEKMSTSSSSNGWGPAEKVGYGLGVAAGATFAIATFPVVVADSPMIGPADLAWFAASTRFMQKSTTLGRKSGEFVDDKMGWN